MLNDRLRLPLQQAYAEALGTAAYAFSLCEWQVVWCSEKIKPGSLRRFVDAELTAGQIAKAFIDLTRCMPKSGQREELKEAAAQFARLVTLRNAILHGKPCSGPDGNSRLSSVKIFELVDLQDAADRFVACDIELNRLFYGFLTADVP